jgi:hypothetical protein
LQAFYHLITPLLHVGFQTLKHHSHPIDIVSCFYSNYHKHHGLATIGVTVLELDILEDCPIWCGYHHSSWQQTSLPYWVLSIVGWVSIFWETQQVWVLGGFLILNLILKKQIYNRLGEGFKNYIYFCQVSKCQFLDNSYQLIFLSGF